MKAVGRSSWHGSEFHTGKTGEHQLGRSQKDRRPKAWDVDMGSNRTLVAGYGRHLPGNKTHKGTTAYENGAEEHRTKSGLVAYAEKMRKLADAGSGIKNNDSFDAAMAIMPEFRNKRSVWAITTKGYSEAHFATFPPEIPEICIRAGSREGDTVLDPFNGAGTTGLVATRLGRSYVGIELNAAYVEMAERRITQDAPLFNTVASTEEEK